VILLGLAIMVVTETATLAGLEPFASWNTPIAWTGFILFADGVVYRARRNSWIRSAPREFALLAAASIPLWIVFEGYNLVIDNWYYSGLPESFWLREIGFAWSFATIWPAIFEGAELVAVVRAGRSGAGLAGPRAAGPGGRGPRSKPGTARDAAGARVSVAAPRAAAPAVAVGLAMLACPFFVPAGIARYLAAPVWLGFIVLLDPINRRLGAEVLTRDRVINLAWSGFVCGALWEFWNYWSHAKWHYTVPIMANVKIFEMPLPGYLGFPAFALECFTMYVFVRHPLTKPGRTIAL
jgi:hypothetical protein